jgi:hypothetical protein
LSGSENAVTEFTFREGFTLHGHQDAVNPLAGAAAAAATKYVYLIKTNYGTDTKYFKVVFDSYGPAGQCKITVVPGSGAGEEGKIELTAGLTGIADGYGYIYFDLHGTNTPRVLNDGNALKSGITLNIPKAAEWDLLCTRTDDVTGDTTRPTANRSSILLNTYKGVTAATAAGKTIEEVTDTTGLTASTLVDAIGYSWYATDNRGTYWIDPVTYVIQTAEGHYAKFQPGSFKNSSGDKNFHMAFRYYYTGNGTEVFDH